MHTKAKVHVEDKSFIATFLMHYHRTRCASATTTKPHSSNEKRRGHNTVELATKKNNTVELATRLKVEHAVPADLALLAVQAAGLVGEVGVRIGEAGGVAAGGGLPTRMRDTASSTTCPWTCRG